MIDPSLALQVAIVAALKACQALAALVRDKVFDAVPADAKAPYVQVGQPHVLPDKADCIDGAKSLITVHGWSRGPQSVEIKNMGAAIAGALDDAELVLDGHRTVICLLQQIQYLPDPDVTIQHVAVTLLICTEPT